MELLSALVSVGVRKSVAEVFVDPLTAALPMFGIDTKEAVAAFIGQTAVESTRYTTLEERLSYSTLELMKQRYRRVRELPVKQQLNYLRNPEGLANLVYSGKFGNGDVASGDGWRYRGRGLIQTTFFANYKKAEESTGRPYTQEPDLLMQPSDAVLSAAAYFRDNGCIEAANRGLVPRNIDDVTKRINPAMLEDSLRRSLTQLAFNAL